MTEWRRDREREEKEKREICKTNQRRICCTPTHTCSKWNNLQSAMNNEKRFLLSVTACIQDNTSLSNMCKHGGTVSKCAI